MKRVTVLKEDVPHSPPRRLRKRSLFAPILDEALGEKLILRLYEAYVNRFGVYIAFNASNAPQNKYIPGMDTAHINRQHQSNFMEKDQGVVAEDRVVVSIRKIKKGSKKYLIWLFFATLTDRRQVSMEVYKSHVLIHRDHPELYTKDVITMDEKKLGATLSRYRVGCPNQSATYWIKCAKVLFEEFEGNPLKLLEHCGLTVEGVNEFKRREKRKSGRGYDPLPGYGPKITSLYTLFLAEMGTIQMPEDSFPVDVHVQRLFIQNEAIINRSDTYNEELEDMLRVFICKIAKLYNLDKVHLSHAFWQLGRTLCNGCYRVRNIELLCPTHGSCLGTIETADYYAKGTWPIREQSVFAPKGLRAYHIEQSKHVHLPLFD